MNDVYKSLYAHKQINASKGCFKLLYIYFLGFEVDKPFKILIKTLNAVEYIQMNIQNHEGPKTDDPII